jgi:8-amino-7-oxononanoate synthase
MKIPNNLSEKLADRLANGSLRKLSVRQPMTDFSSNDYLGFAGSKAIAEGVQKELTGLSHINGSTGSRLLSGNFELHEAVESSLALFFKAQSALLFNSGYDAHIGLLSSVPQRGDRIFYDELCHASIRDGIRLSHASAYGFRHNDTEDLNKKFQKTNTEKGNVYLVVEGVYSMDGDLAPLVQLAQFAHDKGIRLIVDEAHATGVFGEMGAGLTASLGLEPYVFARVHTFGKSMGCHGAAVLGSRDLRQYLVNFARSFIYTTALPQHSVLTIKHALLQLKQTRAIEQLFLNIAEFKRVVHSLGMDHLFLKSSSPVQSCLLSPPERVKEISQRLMDRNFDARPILSPTVPKGQERIRFCLHSYNTYQEIQDVLLLLSTFA